MSRASAIVRWQGSADEVPEGHLDYLFHHTIGFRLRYTTSLRLWIAYYEIPLILIGLCTHDYHDPLILMQDGLVSHGMISVHVDYMGAQRSALA